SELRQTAARLAERVDAELQFEAILGHELRTPLLAIMSFAALLKRNGMSMDRVKELAGYLEQDAERAQRLIDQLLDLDRVESGRAPLLIERVNVYDALSQVVATLSPASPRHPFRLAGARDAVVLADRDRLIQVFTNLLVNAVKYSPDGGDVEIDVTSESGRVHVRVRDHGLGIPPTELERIFQKHTRIHTARDIKGSGLGLQLVRAIVELHGGRVWAESEGEGSGATLNVLLSGAPAVDAEAPR
ncbi:MAG TPA: HAMP domain-containing sensor histidine kinase, partial [Candidatus Limnocylindria bacterium]|nr:HAMP domain-containing sensor histidine kinase [Candidatus Limnocylindria bacterium]